jgi:hypothetical protein
MNRIGGLSSILSGVLLFLGHVLNLGAKSGDGTVLGETLILSAHLLLVFSFFWLYAAQGKRNGLLGLPGMIAGVAGTVLVTEIVFVEIAGASGVQVDSVLAAGVPGFIQTFGSLLFVLGMLLFGSSIIRGQAFPRSGGVLLIVGTLVFSAGSFAGDAEALVAVAGSAITGGGFVRLGLAHGKEKALTIVKRGEK